MKIYRSNPPVKIRKKLDELCNRIKNPFYDPYLYNKVFFPEFSGKLKTILPPPVKNAQYNCYAYALGLEKHIEKYTFISIVKNGNIIPTVKPKNGDIVVYYNNGDIRHAGLYKTSSKVISKWGPGPVFLHETFMCPASYGDRVEFFGNVSKNVIKKIILKYPRPN